MQTKISVVRAHMARGEWREAIRISARFSRLGEERAAILDAHTAYTNERFMVQLGKDVEALKESGRLALIRRFGE